MQSSEREHGLGSFRDFELSGIYWDTMQNSRLSCYRLDAISRTEEDYEYFSQDVCIPYAYDSRRPEERKEWLKGIALDRIKKRIEEEDFEFGMKYTLLLKNSKGDVHSDGEAKPIEPYKD